MHDGCQGGKSKEPAQHSTATKLAPGQEEFFKKMLLAWLHKAGPVQLGRDILLFLENRHPGEVWHT